LDSGGASGVVGLGEKNNEPVVQESTQMGYLSARAASNPNLSADELEAAEVEAEEWVRRVNRC